MKSTAGWALVAAGLVFAAVTAGVVILQQYGKDETPPPVASDALPPDPRLSYAGPYSNVRPDVQYVGDAVCAECHADKAKTFRKHPMGQSLMPVKDGPALALDKGHNNPFPKFGSQFGIEKSGDNFRQFEERNDEAGKVIYAHGIDVQYVIGSGNHGHSFLSDKNGYVFQGPISWYSSKNIWDMSPGWQAFAGGRPVRVDCLYCHSNRVEPVAGHLNRFREPVFRGFTIGCERCHGPGEEHAAAWGGKGKSPKGQDYSIVNPRKLTPALREAVCQQCHLEGEKRLVRRGREPFDFRPGLALQDFYSIFVHAGSDDDHKAVNHVEQMYQSTCFKKSAGQMGCISCHDPHVKVPPEERVAYFKSKCMDCHQSKGCNVPVADRRKTSPADSCIDCHMKKSATSDIVHTAGTDHRILRVPDPGRRRGLPHSGVGPDLPVRLFHKPPPEKRTDEESRDLGIALSSLSISGHIHPGYANEALRLLDPALRQNPHDAEAWEAKGGALQQMGRRLDALLALQTALACDPKREAILTSAALLAQDLNRTDEALDYWRRALEMNPWQPHYHGNIALILLRKPDLEGAHKHGEEWMKLDPGNLDLRKFWVSYWTAAGQRDKAKTEFEKIEALKPPNLAELQAWYARMRR